MPVLFVTNGFYRIEPCCFFGRIPSKEYTSKRTYCKAHDNTPWLYLSSYVGKLLQGNRNTYSKNHTDYTTSNAQQNSLDKELVEDVYSPGSNTHSQANLSGSFCDAHIHNIHDSNATHNQRNTRNTTEQNCNS